VFSHLTPQQIKDLEALGVQKAIEILQKYIVSYYKEKLKTSGRGRGKVRRGRGNAPAAGRGGPINGVGRGEGTPSTLFTTAPLPLRRSIPQTPSSGPATASTMGLSMPPMASLQMGHEDSTEEVIIVDDDPVDDYPALKRRRVDSPGGSDTV